MSVKNIVTNVAALKAKYGTNYPIIQAALTPVIAHDSRHILSHGL